MNIECLFDNNPSSIPSLLQHVLGKISRYYGSAITTDKIISCKHVLIELLTNGVKHSGNESSLISIVLSTLFISISKTDTGERLTIEQFGPVPGATRMAIVCKSDYERLVAVSRENSAIHFELIEELTPDPDPASLLMDHYGFLIISRAAYSFNYQYNKNWGINTFTAKIGLYESVVDAEELFQVAI